MYWQRHPIVLGCGHFFANSPCGVRRGSDVGAEASEEERLPIESFRSIVLALLLAATGAAIASSLRCPSSG